MRTRRSLIAGSILCLIVLAVIVAALPLMTACAKPAPTGGPTPAAPIILKLCHTSPPTTDNNKHVISLKFQELVQERSNGRVKVEIYPAGQLYNDADGLTATANGTVFGIVSAEGPLAAWDNGWQIFAALGIFDDVAHAKRWTDSAKGGGALAKRLESKGLIARGTDVGWSMLFTTNKPITRIEDVKGMRIRVMESPISVDMVKAVFGSDAIILPVTDLYTAAQQGMIQGTVTLPLSIYSRKLHEVFKCCLTSPLLGYTQTALVISKIQLSKLPTDIQKIVLGCFDDACEYARDADVMGMSQRGAMDAIAKAGETLTTMSPEESQKLMELYQPVLDKYTPVIGKDLIDEARRLRK